MPRKVLIQPNGKYGIYSSIVDNLVHYNLTEDQCIEIFIRENNLSLQEAKDEVARSKNYSWEEDMYFALYMHGIKLTHLTECGMSPEEVQTWIEKAEKDHKEDNDSDPQPEMTDDQKRLLVYERVLDEVWKFAHRKDYDCPFCGDIRYVGGIHAGGCLVRYIEKVQSADKIEIEAFLKEIQENEMTKDQHDAIRDAEFESNVN